MKGPMTQNRLRRTSAGTAVILAAIGLAAAQQVAGSLLLPDFKATWKTQPTMIPRSEPTPVSAAFNLTFWELAPDSIRTVEVLIDRDVGIGAEAIPACGRSELETFGIGDCARSVVGNGTLHLSGNAEDGPASVPLLLLNAGNRHGVPRLLIYGVVGPTPVVASTRFTRAQIGAYGWRAVTTVPSIEYGEGLIDEVSFRFGRNGYLSATCPGERLRASRERLRASIQMDLGRQGPTERLRFGRPCET
jgi:hypothetical protein